MLEREWQAECRELLDPNFEKTAKVEEAKFNLVVPRSRCSECGHQVTALENIPILSYLFLRGRCSGCGTRISVQYPLVEAASGLLAIITAWHFGYGWQAAGALAFTWALLALSVIDLRTKLLPDAITLPLLWLGIVLNFNGVYTDLESSVLGAIFGYLSLWSVYHLFRLLTGKEGMGFGDFKLLAALGAWMGWQALPVIILLSSIVGAAVGIGMILILGRDKNIPIPFGPYLAMAGWIALLWGQELTQAYLDYARIP